MPRVRQPPVPLQKTLDRHVKKGAKKPPAKECPLGLTFRDVTGSVYVVTETKTGTRRWSKKADFVSKGPNAKAQQAKNPKKKQEKEGGGCSASTLSKYSGRPSPPYPAGQCPLGMTLKGNDGNVYEITATKAGVHRWTKKKT